MYVEYYPGGDDLTTHMDMMRSRGTSRFVATLRVGDAVVTALREGEWIIQRVYAKDSFTRFVVAQGDEELDLSEMSVFLPQRDFAPGEFVVHRQTGLRYMVVSKMPNGNFRCYTATGDVEIFQGADLKIYSWQ